jgi:hypothetical protein
MRIKKLELKNGYKRFHHLTIDLGDRPARIVALVGPNGCGKSSVLDAMLFHNAAHNQIGNKGGRDHNYHSLHGISDYRWDSIAVDIDSGPLSDVRQRKAALGKQNTIFSFRSCYRYNSGLKIRETHRSHFTERLRRIGSRGP